MTKRLAWLTDIHLNFLTKKQEAELWEQVIAQNPDAVLLGGDISEADRLLDDLREIAARLDRPVYFVLGNHDFYRGSIVDVEWDVSDLCKREPHLTWLSEKSVIELTPDTALIGHDGWGDGRLGKMETALELTDDLLIRELASLRYNKVRLFGKLYDLGNRAAEHVWRVLPSALERYPHTYFLTHVPPFQESCWYEGKTSDDDNPYLPRFTCAAMGEALREIMAAHPDRQLTVLCGHTHGEGTSQILPNLKTITGGAEYGELRIQGLFTI